MSRIEQAVVLAGGLGTRLGELTKGTPKPLLEVGGKPFLAHLVGELRRQGVERILISGGFAGEKLVAAFAGQPDVTVRIEPEPLGTGGALHFVAGDLDDRFFFMNGDSLFDIDVWDLDRAGVGAPAALALRRVEDAGRYGSVELDGETITAFGEKRGPGPGVINGGVAALSRSVLDLIATGRAVSIEAEVYPVLAERGELKGRIYDGAFLDIGVPEDFARSHDWIRGVLAGRD